MMADPTPSNLHSFPLQGRQQRALGEMIPFVVLATLAVICRFLSRRLKKTAIGADDLMVIVGLIFTFATFADSVVREYTTSYPANALFGMTDLPSIRNLSRSGTAHVICPKREFISIVEGMQIVAPAVNKLLRLAVVHNCRQFLQSPWSMRQQ